MRPRMAQKETQGANKDLTKKIAKLSVIRIQITH